MKSPYANPLVLSRLIEFLGGDSLENATAVYITESDSCQFDRRQLRHPAELTHFLTRNLDIARSLADTKSLLFHLDIEYVNFDSPDEAYRDPERTFDLQEPVVRAIQALLLQWGIRPLHLITGQGHHFVWRIGQTSDLAARIATLCPTPELLDACHLGCPEAFRAAIDHESRRAFSAISLLMEYVAHRIKDAADSLSSLPVQITAVQVGPGATGKREIISIDISEYGDPLYTRMVRMPFTNYLKPCFNGFARSHGSEGEIASLRSIPLHEIDIRQALAARLTDESVLDLASRASVRIPDQTSGTARLLEDYLTSHLRVFHKYFYSEQHDAKERWHETYDRTPAECFPLCIRQIVDWPNGLLLKPAGMQLVTRCLLAAGWHPRHIAGFIRSKFENSAFNWGGVWENYVPALRADFYVRLFAGLHATGLDPLIDMNCVSTREKGFCVASPPGACSLNTIRQTLAGLVKTVPTVWPIALSTGCFYRHSIFTVLEAIRDSGFREIEVCSFPAHLDYHHEEGVRRAGETIRALGLRPTSFHAPFADWIDITSLDEKARAAAVAELIVACRAAVLLGAEKVVLHPGPEQEGRPPQEEFHRRLRNAATSLNQVAAYCCEAGVSLLLENMLPHLLFGRTSDMMFLLGEIDACTVGACLDTGHARLSGDLGSVFHKLSGHLKLVHISDNMGDWDAHLVPGEGSIDWPWVITELHRQNFRGDLVIEMSARSNESMESTLARARRGRDFLALLLAAHPGDGSIPHQPRLEPVTTEASP